MTKTLLYKLFKVGKMPNSIKEKIAEEGIVYLEEGILGFMSYRDNGGIFSPKNRVRMTVSIGLSKNVFILTRGKDVIFDLPLKDEKFQQLKFNELKGDLLIQYKPDESEKKNPGYTEVEYKLCVKDIKPFRFLM